MNELIEDTLRRCAAIDTRNQERRRIISILLSERSAFALSENSRIVTLLDSLIEKIQQDHNQDSER